MVTKEVMAFLIRHSVDIELIRQKEQEGAYGNL